MSRKKMAPDLKRVVPLALMIYANAVSATIFEPASPLNIIPGGKLESEVFESTDSEILRRDLFNENWDANQVDTVYGGPYDFLWFEKDKDNDVGSNHGDFAYLQGANSTLRHEFDVQHHLEF